MKFIFVDEFKIPKIVNGKKMQWYGLTACMIDSSYYEKYKKGFASAFKDLRWGEQEIKGRYVYSKKGNKEITVDERLDFTRKLFTLSKSKTGKNSIIHAYVTFELFDVEENEEDIYLGLMGSLVKKIPGASTRKGDKNLVAFFIDNNECLSEENTETTARENLKGKNVLFERPFFTDSSNLTPGVILADFVCYFHQNYIQIRDFTNSTKKEFRELVNKFEEKTLTENERGVLERHIINLRKSKQTKELLGVLSQIEYI